MNSSLSHHLHTPFLETSMCTLVIHPPSNLASYFLTTLVPTTFLCLILVTLFRSCCLISRIVTKASYSMICHSHPSCLGLSLQNSEFANLWTPPPFHHLLSPSLCPEVTSLCSVDFLVTVCKQPNHLDPTCSIGLSDEAPANPG